MKNKRITSSDVDNVLTESFLYKRFKLLALNMFEYGNLDTFNENIEERHIEKFLFDFGKCCAFEDPLLGKMILPCEGIGFNVLNDPTSYRVTGFNYSKEIKAEDCVLIENNKLRMATDEIIKFFTRQLYEIVRARDINIKTLKIPFIIPTDDKTVFTMKKIFDDIDNNVYAIFPDKNIVNSENGLQVLQTGVKPYTAELTDVYHDILNEALTYLGINNANTDKKERLITDEANANNQLIESCANMFLEARQRAVDKINEMFGSNITVKLRNQGGEDYALDYVQELTTSKQQPNDNRVA